MSCKSILIILLTFLLASSVSAIWFDTDYDYKHNISQKNTSQELLGSLNGTSPIDEGYDSQDHWIYGTWRGSSGENLDIYHQNQSQGGWNQTKITNSSTEYCVIQTLPTNYTSCPNPPPGLVAYYPLDEDDSKAWDHIGGNHGTINGPTQGATGQIGKAYDFKNDDSIDFSNSKLDISSDFSINYWINPDETNPSEEAQVIMENGKEATSTIKNGEIRFRVYDGSNNYASHYSISDSTWTMMTATWNATNNNLKLYQDAIQNPEGSNLANGNAEHTGFKLGDHPSSGYDYDGQIDAVSIYNRVLSKDEVKALYYNKASLGVEETQETNNAPVLESNTPDNINKNNKSGVTLEAEIGDSEGDKMNLTFYNATDDSQIDKIKNANNGTYTTTWNNLNSDKKHEYYIEITDGKDTTTSSTFSFTTIDIDITWDDNSDNEDGFKIYQNSTGSYTDVADVASNTENYRDTNQNLQFGKKTCYEVTSYNSNGESDPTTECITP